MDYPQNDVTVRYGREQTCCFTGHRPEKLPWRSNEDDPRCNALKTEIFLRLKNIYSAGYRHYICGMALGCDTYYFEQLLKLRALHPEIVIEAAVPCDSQSKAWSTKEKERYAGFLEQCDRVTYVQHVYTKGCMQKRNRYMIDNSSLLLACFNGTPGGTMSTILLAERSNLETEIIEY